jgi:glutathione S-transferase
LNGAGARQKALRLLLVLEAILAKSPWLAANTPTLADVCCYPSIAMSKDSEISLDSALAVQTWLGRVRNLPGYVGMPGFE